MSQCIRCTSGTYCYPGLNQVGCALDEAKQAGKTEIVVYLSLRQSTPYLETKFPAADKQVFFVWVASLCDGCWVSIADVKEYIVSQSSGGMEDLLNNQKDAVRDPASIPKTTTSTSTAMLLDRPIGVVMAN
jgi:hypothetical protein